MPFGTSHCNRHNFSHESRAESFKSKSINNNKKKTLKPTKKDILHPKTKKKPQQDGRKSAIMIKSNPILTGWATHKLKNNYTIEALPLEWKFGAACQTPQPAGLASGADSRVSGFEGQQHLIADCHRTGQTETLLLDGAHKVSYKIPGTKSVTS